MLEPYGVSSSMLQPHGDLTDRHVRLTYDEFCAAQDGCIVMRGNGRFCNESWIAEKNYPDVWNTWTCVRPEPGYTLEDYGGPQGREYSRLQTFTDIWWFGAYRGVGYTYPKGSYYIYRLFHLENSVEYEAV